MPTNLSIKNAPDDVVRLLREQARLNHRSLQGELLAIIEGAVRTRTQTRAEAVFAKIQKLGVKSPSESVAMIREDRDNDRR